MLILVGKLQVKDFARVSDSIIGWGSSVGRWARIDNKSVIGEDVHVKVHRHSCLSCTEMFSDFVPRPDANHLLSVSTLSHDEATIPHPRLGA